MDAKSLIEMMMGGGGARQGQGGGQGGSGLEDLLRNLTGGQQGGQGGGLNLEDLMRNLQPNASSDGGATAGESGGASGGGLGDLLGNLQQQFGGGQGGGSASGGQGGGGILGQIGDVFKQATDGAREGAGKIGEATGAGGLLEQLTGGRSSDEVMAQIQDLIKNNKLGAGAALGGLGALVLGTRTGRSAALSAAKIGALALIGGLAYKAYQNYSQGQAPTDTGAVEPEPAPSGSGFEESAVTDTAATAYLRAMIAAAASDGRLDADEQKRITANLVDAGIDSQAEEFIAREISAPASVDELASAVSSEREAIQIYTAARLSIDPDTIDEQEFLANLAARLQIDEQLARHIDATARNLNS